MDDLEIREQIARMKDEFDVVIANTPELLAECFNLRHQVYCVEKSFFEAGNNGKETDDLDDRARHILLRHRESGEATGTVRVIPSSSTGDLGGFPMSRFCIPGLLRKLPITTSCEISRFAVSKVRRSSCHASTMVRLGLIQGIVRLSNDMGLTHWCAIMEPILLRLLQRNAIYFTPLGALVEHHGMRQPSSAHIGTVLNRMRSERVDMWNYVTLGGTLWNDSTPALRVA
jgi:N-acyl-L-homoserine lactone synthetase